MSSAEPRTPAAVAQELAGFEADHPVTEWECGGWKVWPHLRASTARRALDRQNGMLPPSAAGEPPGRASNRLQGYRQVVARSWRERQLNRRIGAPLDGGADVLVVAGATRRQQIGRLWLHFVADPLVDCLERQGLRCMVWQAGEPRQPAYRPARHISASAHLASLVRRRLAGCPVPAAPPPWFSSFSALCEGLAVPAPHWSKLASSIRYISVCSDIMRSWIRGAGVRIVMVDCWTEWMQLAAVIAARREGLDVVDVQHGIQEHGHPSYHHWTVAPTGGWQAWPTLFWVWGDKARQLHIASNGIVTEAICGGNPWLNAWRGENCQFEAEIRAAKDRTSGCRRAVLVTMTRPAWRQLDYVEAAVLAAPADWAWLLRLHPSTSSTEREAVRRRLADTCPGQIRLEEGSDTALYALLNASHAHVSMESTVCLEALAFGKPSVLISDRGARMFQQYVDAGIMLFAPRPQDLPATLEQAMRLSSSELRQAGNEIFAGPESTQAACEDMCRRSTGRGGAGREAAATMSPQSIRPARAA